MPGQNEDQIAPDPAAAKTAARRDARARRDGVADRERSAAAIAERVLALPEVMSAHVVLGYRAVGSEVPVDAVLAACAAAGRRVVVPEAAPDAEPPSSPAEIDVALVPGLAFTPAGVRLGQGGGWYDRVLPRLRSDCTVIGVAFAGQVVEDLPEDDHDVRVDVVVTETATYHRPTA